jgi:DNA invertase Pin-like site-specific DNA recombinase
VAAYARVSTDAEEQINSYEAQVDFYTNYIKSKDEWEFTAIYTDEGITATNTKKRDGFNTMVRDALDGKIDFIITKSVSRFARNTVDSLNTIRALKERGVEVYFEKENIYTFDGKGELMLTIMSSLAQEESRSISENVKWGLRKRMRDGRVSMAYKHFLGYDKGSDGKPQIVEKEAETVRLIYRLFLQGASLNVIAKHLTDSGAPTPTGKKQWCISTVHSILRNEKYMGDALLQKTYIDDFLTKKVKVNKGEIPQFYVAESHPAIIEAETFEMAREEIRKRGERGSRQQSGRGCFSSRVVCGECGGFFGSKVWHSTSKYRRTVWRCNQKYGGGKKCNTPHVYEDDIKRAFIAAFNMLVSDREQLIKDYDSAMNTLTDTAEQDEKSAELRTELEVVGELIGKTVAENAATAQDQSDYNRRYDALTARYKEITAKLDNISAERKRRAVTRENAACLLDSVSRGKLLDEFDETTWRVLVDYATVGTDGSITVIFKDGREVNISHEK